MDRKIGIALAAIVALGLTMGCGKGVSEASKQESFALKGVIKGLDGTGLMITNTIDGNIKDTLTYDAPNILLGGDVQDISFTFSSPVVNGNQFSVGIGQQPAERFQTCEVKNGSGQVRNSDVNNIEIICVTRKFPVSGKVQGLMEGATLTIRNINNETVTVSGNNEFTFPNEMTSGDSYIVNVDQPVTKPEQRCSVSNSRGTVRDVAVTSLVVTCASIWHSLNMQVSGLRNNEVLLRSDVAGDLLITSSDSNGKAFNYVPEGAGYSLTVLRNPVDPYQECRFQVNNIGVDKAIGVMGDGDITIDVRCEDKKFYVKGIVNGLSANGLRLRNNVNDLVDVNLPAGKPVGSTVTFQFGNPLKGDETYNVSVVQQPGVAQTCVLSANNGKVVNHDVIVVVNCETNSFTLGGTVSGLSPSGTGMILANNQNTVNINSNGTYSFLAPIRGGAAYDVVVDAAPRNPSQTCAVSRGKGLMGSANVSNVDVTCNVNRYSVGGTVSGLAANAEITLRNNGGDDLIVTANGAFKFSTDIVSGEIYSVTVLKNPTNQICGVSKASGNVGNGRISNIEVNCVSTYTLSGKVSGLLAGRSLILRDTRGVPVSVAHPDDVFLMPSPYFTGNSYNVSVAKQPAGETCNVSGGNGVMGSANVTAIAVNCLPNPYIVKVSVINYTGSGLILKNNDVPVNLNADKTYSVSIDSGTDYNFSADVSATSPRQQCEFTGNNNTGSVFDANVDITLDCAGVTRSIGGTMTGYSGSGLVLSLNDSPTTFALTGSSFTLAARLSAGAAYRVTVATQPTNQKCTIANGEGIIALQNITTVKIVCGGLYTVSGLVGGLATGSSIELLSSMGDHVIVNRDGAFTLPTLLASGEAYGVTVASQPASNAQTCAVTSGGTGVVSTLNIASIRVRCGINWHWARPTPQGNPLYGVAWNGLAAGDARYVAVGRGGTVLTSTDTVNWEGREIGSRFDFNDVAWKPPSVVGGADGYFIAGITNGYATSTDGQNWTVRNFNVPDFTGLSSIAWSGTRFVAATNSSPYYATSTDGLTWTQHSNGPNYAGRVMWTGNRFVVISRYGDNAYASVDGLEWTSKFLDGTFRAHAVRPATDTAAALIVLAGSIVTANGVTNAFMTSSDGVGWTITATDTSADVMTAATWTGTRFVVMGMNGTVWHSADGLDWRTTTNTASTNSIFRVAALGTTMVAVGAGGVILTSASDNPDLSAWTNRSAFVSNNNWNSPNTWRSVNWVGGQLILGGSGAGGAIATGSSATTLATTPSSVGSGAVVSMAYSNTLARYLSFAEQGAYYYSPDASKWTAATAVAMTSYSQVIWAGGQFVLVGSNYDSQLAVSGGALATSADGLQWNMRDPKLPQTPINSVCWTGTSYVAVGNEGAISSSSADGVTWTARLSNTSQNLYRVVCNGGFVVAVGGGDTIVTSSNGGLDWTVQNTNAGSANFSELKDVVKTDTRYVAVGTTANMVGTYGKVFTSVDGVNWVNEASPAAVGLVGLAWTGSQLVAIGDYGAVLYAQ